MYDKFIILNKYFNKSDIITNKFKEIGITRDKLRKEFDSIIEVVKTMAEYKGYCFIEQKINNNSGRAYALLDIPPTDDELNQLIQ